jgi:hypothetical protein
MICHNSEVLWSKGLMQGAKVLVQYQRATQQARLRQPQTTPYGQGRVWALTTACLAVLGSPCRMPAAASSPSLDACSKETYAHWTTQSNIPGHQRKQAKAVYPKGTPAWKGKWHRCPLQANTSMLQPQLQRLTIHICGHCHAPVWQQCASVFEVHKASGTAGCGSVLELGELLDERVDIVKAHGSQPVAGAQLAADLGCAMLCLLHAFLGQLCCSRLELCEACLHSILRWHQPVV